MIYNKNGEMFFYEDKMFIIGEEVYSIENGLYGLFGRISEIRTGEDRETENEGPDIYCTFRKPVLMRDKPWISNLPFGSDDIDLVNMAPEMLIPTRLAENTGLQKMIVYAVVKDCAIDGRKYDSVKLFSERTHAEIVMRKYVEKDKSEGDTEKWRNSVFYREIEKDGDFFCAFICDEYYYNHNQIYIAEAELSPSVNFVEQMLPVSLAMKYRKDVAEQIEPWNIPEAVKRTAINDPSLYMRVEMALEEKELYKEEYSEAISEVAHKLADEHTKIETMLKQAGKDGKL